LVTIGYSN